MHRVRGAAAFVVAAMVISLGVGIPSASASPVDTSYELVSLSTSNVPTTGQHLNTQISRDGRYVAFDSDSQALVPNPNRANGWQTYVRDRVNNSIEQATLADDGSEPNGPMYFSQSRFSKDGRHVEFISTATNLVDTPVGTAAQAYIRNLDNETTELVSVGPNGEPANHDTSLGDMSSDDRYVFFSTWATNWSGANPNGYDSMWVRDRVADTTTLLMQGTAANGGVEVSNVSADGNLVLYRQSPAGSSQLWLLNRNDGTSQRVDVSSTGAGSASAHHDSLDISDDGNVVAFEDDTALDAAFPGATNQIYVRNVHAGTTKLASVSNVGTAAPVASGATVSGDGKSVGFVVAISTLSGPPEWDPGTDSYVRNLANGSTWHVGVDGYGVNSEFGSFDLATTGNLAALVAAGNGSSGLNAPDTSRYVFVATRTPDTQPPVVTGTTDISPGPDGWYNQPPTINWSTYDPPPSDGGPATHPPSIVANLDGLNTYTSDPACDADGHCATGSLAVGLDRTAPTVLLIAPADGERYAVGQNASASYQCDDAGGSGVHSCLGNVANDAPLDTSTPGNFSFVETATDGAGNVTTVQHDYTVEAVNDNDPPTVTIQSPVDGSFVFQNASLRATYSCDDGTEHGTGIASCIGPRPNGGPVDTSTPGAHVFPVTGKDLSGNTTTVSATYNVIAPLDVADTLPGGGGTFTSDTGGTGPTPATPVQTGIQSPVGGAVEVTQTAATTTAPPGYSLLGVQENITAPVASVDNPLTLKFSLDKSLLDDAGLTVADVAVLRDGVPIGSCADPAQVSATPDPCVFSRQTLPDGDGEVDIYSVHASKWNFAAQQPTPALSLTTGSLTHGTVGVSYSQALAASGGAVPYVWSLASGTLPAGLTLNRSTGLISGVPRAVGTFSVSLHVADATLPSAKGATRSLSLVVAPTAVPTLAKVGVPYWRNVAAFRGTAPYRWTLSAGQLPTGLTLNTATGDISGTPTREGIFAAVILITDSHRPSHVTARVPVAIAVAPAAIVINPSTLPVASRTVRYAKTLTASGGTAPYRFSIASGKLPAGLTLSSAGALSGKATKAGTSTFVVTAADLVGFTATRQYTLVVT